MDEARSGALLSQEALISGGMGTLVDVAVGIDGNIDVASTSAIVRLVRNP